MNRKLKVVLIIILVVLILFLINKFFYKGLKNTAFLVLSPIQRVLWQEDNIFSNVWEYIFKVKSLKKENREINKENLFLKSEIIRLKDLEEENKDLRQALDIELEKDFQLIFSQVVARENDSLLINKGGEDGVFEGMPVITKEKVLIGKVNKVFNNFSEVMLISEEDFSFSVEVETEEESVLGVSKGKGDLKLKIELLPKEALIEKGDIVSTSVLGGVFPKNLLVGEIKSIKRTDPEPFQQGEIEPYFKQVDIKTLFLIKDER